MVDWDRVERLRSKGLDWETIVDDPKVGFTAPEGVGDQARALKALYYSKKSRGGGKSKKGSVQEPEGGVERIKRVLIPVGLAVAIIGGIWAAFAYETSLVGVFLGASYVAVVAVVGLVTLGAGLVVGTVSFGQVWKKPVAVGVVVGLVLAGGLALAGASLGVCNLSGNTVSEPGGWQSETPRNALCPSSGPPVIFFYGSIACPYCSASSWAINMAIDPAFGTLSGTSYSTSDPTDVYPNTPAIDFAVSSLSSSYASWDAKEGTNDYSTSALPPLNWQEQAYVNTYDGTGGIPFLTIGGIFVHSGSLVNPSIFSSGGTLLTPQQVAQDLANPSQDPAVYNAIHTAAQYMEAFLVKADQIANITPPASMTSDTAVMNIVSQIH